MVDATKRRVLGLLSALTSAALVAVACSGNDAPAGDEPGTGGAAPDGPRESYEGEDFYAVPDPLPGGEPGDLLRYQVIDSPTVPGAELARIMYLSESVAGDPIAVTGLVAVPDGPAPAGGRPLVSIGHGSSGISDVCAPSRLTRPYLSWERSRGIPEVLDLLGAFAGRGYVVAATDYEGLGTPGVHPILVGESEGRGILDAAKAARQLPGADASDRVGIWGYSQGGHAALWANQLAQDWAPDLAPVGTVAGAPAAEQPSMFAGAGAIPELHSGFVLWVAGFAQAYPHAEPSQVLTDAGIRVMEGAKVAEACGRVGVDMSPAAGQPIARDGFAAVEPWASLMAANDPGHVATDTPILLLHSAADEVVPQSFTETLFQRLCRLGQTIESRVYDQGDSHGAAMHDTATDGLAWIDTRMTGQQATSNCP